MLNRIYSVVICGLFILTVILFETVVAQQGFNQITATLSQARCCFVTASVENVALFAGGSIGLSDLNVVDIYNAANNIWTVATLSQARCCFDAISVGNVVLFAGGLIYNGSAWQYLNVVDIYNAANNIWTVATLTQARTIYANVSVGNIVLFAGGFNGSSALNVVDIYNAASNVWTVATLSQARCCFKTASVGNFALFAGGSIYNGIAWQYLNVVDVYNAANNVWTVATLSQTRCCFAAASVGNVVLFAGGFTGSTYSNIVDIYNAASNVWTTATLSQARNVNANPSVGNIVLFAGGSTGSTYLNVVDIYNATSSVWTIATLSQTRCCFVTISVDSTVFFAGGSIYNGTAWQYLNVVDVYNVTSNVWTVATLSQARSGFAAVSVRNVVLFAGGSIYNGTTWQSLYLVDIYILPPFPTSVPSFMPSQSFSPFSSEQTANNNNSNLTLLLAGLLSAGALLIVVAIILLVVLLRKKRNKRNGDEHHNGSHQMALTDTDIVAIETNLNEVTSDETTATTLPPYQQGTETLRGLSPGRIPMNELEIGREIGQGTYGRVCVGKWKKYRVALKFCQNKGKMEEFMREANLMISLPPHPNVVRMYGVSIDGTQPIIVMEYCAGGSLDKVLFDEKQQISLEQKIKWVQEIAEGVKHHKHNIVHRDLAARNILLSYRNSNDAQLKISDFGMSRVLQQDIEAKTMNPIGPIRWMAPESIKQQVYSKKSDVWMFGILVYEIVAQSEPHVNIEPQKILVFIRDKGFTPIIPSNCPVKLRELMELCWNKQPEQRPNFETICAILQQ